VQRGRGVLCVLSSVWQPVDSKMIQVCAKEVPATFLLRADAALE
jgi:hypothetical protein